MNGIIPAANVKILARTLQALSKVGDELYIEIRKDRLSFITFNLSKTVCATFNFLDSFFSNYEVDDCGFSDDGDDDKITCKMHMKVLMPLFKGNLDKKLDFFKIEYEYNADFIIMKMKYRQDDIIMFHKLRLMDSPTLTIGLSADSGCNNLCAPSSFFNQLLTMFCLTDDEITFEVTKPKLIARNYCVGAPLRPKSIRSQVNLNAGEFATYNIQEETTINFALRPFRTVVHFAEGFNLNIGFNFDRGGRPMSMLMKNPTFNANFMIATLNPNSDMQSTMTTTSITSRIIPQKRVNTDRPNITIEDQQALENEDWDDFDFETNVNNEGKDKNETTNAVRNSNSEKSGSSTSIRSTEKSKDNEDENGPSTSKRSIKKIYNNNNKKTSTNKTKSSSSSSGSSHFTQLMNNAMDFLERDMALENNERLVDNNNSKDNNNCDKNSGKRNSENIFLFNHNNSEKETNNEVDDVIPESPESPRRKRARLVFGRCYDPTFQATMLGNVLALESDEDSD